jgi:hypothetical protein
MRWVQRSTTIASQQGFPCVPVLMKMIMVQLSLFEKYRKELYKEIREKKQQLYIQCSNNKFWAFDPLIYLR